MQVLKEKTKEKIDQEALELFKVNGYKGVSMRKIAHSAGMTVGNIYRYYESKDELFSQLLGPTIHAIESLISKDIVESFFYNNKIDFDVDLKMIHLFLEIHRAHSAELYILVHGCEGSRLGSTVNKVIEKLGEKFKVIVDSYNQDNLDVDVVFMSNLLAKNIVQSYIEILYQFDDDTMREKHMVQLTRAMTNLYIKDIMERGDN